ncbi:MAG: hypothetical protein ACO3HC_01925 [Flavobacteriaceae bacterium]
MRVLVISFLICSSAVFSQNEPSEEIVKNNEASINVFNLLIFKALNVSYEYYLNEESGVGGSVLLSLDGDKRFNNDGPFYYESFALTGFYKFYFGRRPNSGFFAELFTMYSNGSYDVDYYYNESTFENQVFYKDFSQFAFGLSVGAKYRSKLGFAGSIYLGVGRNFLDTEDTPALSPRLGITLGYTF